MPVHKKLHLLVILLCILVICGCGKVKQAVTAEGATPQAATSASPTPTATPIAAKSIQMILYYGNENGDDLAAKEVTLMQSPTGTPYLEALNALTKSPDTHSVALFAGFTFLSAELKDGVLNIDLTLPKAKLGAPGEELLLNALKKTMFQFKEIKAIEVLVNGKRVESLLGHVELSHPIIK
jgi:spore germination protein GerM